MSDKSFLHFATDWQDYANHTLKVLENRNDFVNTVDNFAEKPQNRVTTKFERRGQRLNHKIFDIIFNKSYKFR